MLNAISTAGASRPVVSEDLLSATERAANAIGRLDQALENHPLLPAFLYRIRIDAVRRQAAVDGSSIDPWHLAAVIEGLRLRLPDHDGVRIIDRCLVYEAAQSALGLHQWIVDPDFDQEGEVQAAERHLSGSVSLVGVGEAIWSWLQSGRRRAPMRAALTRFWNKRRLLRAPVPLTGPRSLRAEAPCGHSAWTVDFLEALAEEATDCLEQLRNLERLWRSARARAPRQRSTSRAALAVDVMAATPLISATTLAQAIDMSIKGASEMLERFVAAEIAVEVTHRSARRLFGLAGMAPIRDAVAAPRRPMRGRGRGRPRIELSIDNPEPVPASASLPPAARFDRPAIDYAALEEAMAHCDRVLRESRRRLQGITVAHSSANQEHSAAMDGGFRGGLPEARRNFVEPDQGASEPATWTQQ